MAKVLKEFKQRSRAGRTPKYPWDEWLDGRPLRLTRGTDFACAGRSLISLLYARATRSGKKVRISLVDKNTVDVQASPVTSAIPNGRKRSR